MMTWKGMKNWGWGMSYLYGGQELVYSNNNIDQHSQTDNFLLLQLEHKVQIKSVKCEGITTFTVTPGGNANKVVLVTLFSTHDQRLQC